MLSNIDLAIRNILLENDESLKKAEEEKEKEEDCKEDDDKDDDDDEETKEEKEKAEKEVEDVEISSEGYGSGFLANMKMDAHWRSMEAQLENQIYIQEMSMLYNMSEAEAGESNNKFVTTIKNGISALVKFVKTFFNKIRETISSVMNKMSAVFDKSVVARLNNVSPIAVGNALGADSEIYIFSDLAQATKSVTGASTAFATKITNIGTFITRTVKEVGSADPSSDYSKNQANSAPNKVNAEVTSAMNAFMSQACGQSVTELDKFKEAMFSRLRDGKTTKVKASEAGNYLDGRSLSSKIANMRQTLSDITTAQRAQETGLAKAMANVNELGKNLDKSEGSSLTKSLLKLVVSNESKSKRLVVTAFEAITNAVVAEAGQIRVIANALKKVSDGISKGTKAFDRNKAKEAKNNKQENLVFGFKFV